MQKICRDGERGRGRGRLDYPEGWLGVHVVFTPYLKVYINQWVTACGSQFVSYTVVNDTLYKVACIYVFWFYVDNGCLFFSHFTYLTVQNTLSHALYFAKC